MIDPYANFFLKKLFPLLLPEQRINFMSKISLSKVSLNTIGIYPLQALIENLKVLEEKNYFLNVLHEESKIDNIIVDDYGYHIIIKILDCFEENQIENIIKHLIKNLDNFAITKNGVLCLKRLIQIIKLPSTINSLHSKLLKSIENDLINDKFGYSLYVQSIQSFPYDKANLLFKRIKGTLTQLAISRYSSIVLEHCLKNKIKVKFYLFSLSVNSFLRKLSKRKKN